MRALQGDRNFDVGVGGRIDEALRGLGDAAIYVSQRMRVSAGGAAVSLDYVMIRSGRTLIWVINTSGLAAADSRYHLTLHLARDAWHQYSSG